jgi:hypothetical protein
MDLLHAIPRLFGLAKFLFDRSDLNLELLDLTAVYQGLSGVVSRQLILQFSNSGF